MEFKLYQLLKPEQICLDLQARDKAAVIKEMAALADPAKVNSPKELLNCLLERENLETTGVGEGIALPHARTDAVNEALVLFARSKSGIDFQALDEKPVYLLFLIAAPKSESTRVLKMLARVSRLLNNAGFRQALLVAESPPEVIRLFQEKEG